MSNDIEYFDEQDRLRIRLDKPLPRAAGVKLKRAGCVRVRQKDINLEHHPRWTSELRLTRPTAACLILLEQLLGENRIASAPCSLEVARDFLTDDPELRAWIEEQILRALVLRFRFPAVTHSGSCYFWGVRGDCVRVAMYCDRPHKKPGHPAGPACVHIELRLAGTPTLTKYGVLSAGDLSHFDFDGAWSRAVEMIYLPTGKAPLGRLLGRSDVSGTALRKRAHAFLEEGICQKTNKFAIQNVISRKEDGARRYLPRRLERIDFNDWSRSVATKASPVTRH